MNYNRAKKVHKATAILAKDQRAAKVKRPKRKDHIVQRRSTLKKATNLSLKIKKTIKVKKSTIKRITKVKRKAIRKISQKRNTKIAATNQRAVVVVAAAKNIVPKDRDQQLRKKAAMK